MIKTKGYKIYHSLAMNYIRNATLSYILVFLVFLFVALQNTHTQKKKMTAVWLCSVVIDLRVEHETWERGCYVPAMFQHTDVKGNIRRKKNSSKADGICPIPFKGHPSSQSPIYKPKNTSSKRFANQHIAKSATSYQKYKLCEPSFIWRVKSTKIPTSLGYFQKVPYGLFRYTWVSCALSLEPSVRTLFISYVMCYYIWTNTALLCARVYVSAGTCNCSSQLWTHSPFKNAVYLKVKVWFFGWKA